MKQINDRLFTIPALLLALVSAGGNGIEASQKSTSTSKLNAKAAASLQYFSVNTLGKTEMLEAARKAYYTESTQAKAKVAAASNLAELLLFNFADGSARTQSNLEEVVRLQKEALELSRSKHLGRATEDKCHDGYCTAVNKLAQLIVADGRFAEAETLLKEALAEAHGARKSRETAKIVGTESALAVQLAVLQVISGQSVSHEIDTRDALISANELKDTARVEQARTLGEYALKVARDEKDKEQAQSFLRCRLPDMTVSEDLRREYMAAVEAFKQGRKDEAEKSLLTIVQTQPKFVWAYRLLSNLYLKANNLKQAEEYARKAIDTNASYARGWAQLAFVEDARENSKGAREASLKAKELDPSDDVVKQAASLYLQPTAAPAASQADSSAAPKP